MKKTIALLLCSLSATLAAGQQLKAYAVFDATGHEITYGEMLHTLWRKDVVFLGEIHNCPIAHWLEYEIVKDLYARHGKELLIGAEMFERDNQLVLDEYLSGVISADRFDNESKLWPNYKTDYAKIVEFAREHHIPFVATNIPRRYANVVSHGGFEALSRLSEEAKGYIAPLPLNYVRNENVDRYFGATGMPGMNAERAENLSKAQAIKDATMAWSIAQRIGSGKLVHLNGTFHSTAHAGIISYLGQYRPGLSIGTVEVVRQERVDRLEDDMRGKADFYLCVPEEMTTTF